MTDEIRVACDGELLRRVPCAIHITGNPGMNDCSVCRWEIIVLKDGVPISVELVEEES